MGVSLDTINCSLPGQVLIRALRCAPSLSPHIFGCPQNNLKKSELASTCVSSVCVYISSVVCISNVCGMCAMCVCAMSVCEQCECVCVCGSSRTVLRIGFLLISKRNI